MDIAVIGTGFIRGTLGRALAAAGHNVTFGSRRPNHDDVAAESSAGVTPTPLLGEELVGPDRTGRLGVRAASWPGRAGKVAH